MDEPTEPVAPQPESIIQPSSSQFRSKWLVALLLLLVIFGGGWYFYVIGTESTNRPVTNPTQSVLSSAPTSSAPETSLSIVTPVASLSSQPSNQTQTPQTQPNKVSAPSKTVLESGGFQLATKSSYSCQAQAPSDWTMTSNQQSNSADLYSPDRSLYAGYGIQAVNEAIQPYAGAYAAPLNNPDLYSDDPATVVKGYAGAVLSYGLGDSSQLKYTNDLNQTVGNFTLRSLASVHHKGAIFYKTEGFPGDGVNYNYIEPMYVAFTTNDTWDKEGMLVAQVAASIRCTTQFQPHQTADYVSTSGERSADVVKDPNDEDAKAYDYNPQLGTEVAHSEATGTNYLVSPSENWSSDGPDGPGYYIKNGNDVTKLAPGRVD